MCNPHQEGHNHAKRHVALATNKRGISLDAKLSGGRSVQMCALTVTIMAVFTISLHRKPIMRSRLQTIMRGHLIVG